MMKFVGLGQRALYSLVGLALSATLVACGGGGGSAGTPVVGGGGTTTPGTPTVDSAAVSLSLSSTTVTAGAPATLTVKVTNKSGTALPGLIVKFTTDAGLGTFSAASALTDANGTASTVLSPAQATSTGADTVKATVTYLDKPYSASAGFQLTATNVTISSFTSDVSKLSAYGQANLTVTLAGTSATAPVTLSMSSSCTTAGKGSLTPQSQTVSTGRATFTFRDGGCGAVATSENLQISVAGTTLTQSLSLPVSSPLASSIGFVSAAPTSIYLRGSGLIENSNVTFQVKDANNNGLPEQTVVLEPSVLVGGLTLDGSTVPVTKKTDANGMVVVRVNSGTVPTPVRIKATLQGSNISTVSSALAIAVGLPSQLNFSLSEATHNIEGFDLDGTANTYTIIAADRLGNPVPDGTAINFVAEGGQVQAIKLTSLNGAGIATATANFVSASPKPSDGRVTVVAYALGEESFLDLNGDNVYTSGEPFQDLGDLYIDREFNNFYNKDRDQFFSLSLGGVDSCDAWPDEPGKSLLATNVSIPNKPGSCDKKWGRAYVRRAMQTVLSRSTPRLVWGTSWPAGYQVFASSSCPAPTTLTVFDSSWRGDKNFGYSPTDPPVAYTADFYGLASSTTLYAKSQGQGTLYFMVADSNAEAFNPMAAGTTVTAAATDGLTVSVAGGSPVPSTTTPSAAALNYKFDDKTTSGTITITIKSPGGTATAIPVSLSISTTAPTGTLCN